VCVCACVRACVCVCVCRLPSHSRPSHPSPLQPSHPPSPLVVAPQALRGCGPTACPPTPALAQQGPEAPPHHHRQQREEEEEQEEERALALAGGAGRALRGEEVWEEVWEGRGPRRGLRCWRRSAPWSGL
jgi:hypothetical protein